MRGVRRCGPDVKPFPGVIWSEGDIKVIVKKLLYNREKRREVGIKFSFAIPLFMIMAKSISW